jgi:hypothetical protein
MHPNSSLSDGLSLSSNVVAEWVLLLIKLPGLSAKPAGVLLLDPAYDKLHIALADNVAGDENVSEIWASLHEDLEERASEIGGTALLNLLENDLSHFLQLEGPRQQIWTSNPRQTLRTLFQYHVLHLLPSLQ